MAEVIYILCFLSALAAAILLLRSYVKTRHRMLLWTGLGFVFLCGNNLLLIIDLMVVPGISLVLVRHAATLAGATLLVFGLTWDSD